MTFSLLRSSSNICSISRRQSSCMVWNDSWGVVTKGEVAISSSRLMMFWNVGRSWGSWAQQSVFKKMLGVNTPSNSYTFPSPDIHSHKFVNKKIKNKRKCAKKRHSKIREREVGGRRGDQKKSKHRTNAEQEKMSTGKLNAKHNIGAFWVRKSAWEHRIKREAYKLTHISAWGIIT